VPLLLFQLLKPEPGTTIKARYQIAMMSSIELIAGSASDYHSEPSFFSLSADKK
jgi:hypothetical protein